MITDVFFVELQRPQPPLDAEAKAIAACTHFLNQLDPAAALRVTEFLHDKYAQQFAYWWDDATYETVE